MTNPLLTKIQVCEENVDWTIDTTDQGANFIKYKDGRREFVGDDWQIICFLNLKYRKSVENKADSLISILEANIERLSGKKKTIYRNATNGRDKEIFDRSWGYNNAINEEIAFYQDTLNELKK